MANFKPFDTTQKVLITGAAGFIGFHLAKRLLAKGATVLGFDNLNDCYDVTLKDARLEVLRQFPAFTFVKGDLADEQAVETVFSSFQPDIVVNLAAQAGVRYSIDHPRTYIDSNIIGFLSSKLAGTIRLLTCCSPPVRRSMAIRKRRLFRRRITSITLSASMQRRRNRTSLWLIPTAISMGFRRRACASLPFMVLTAVRTWLISSLPIRSAMGKPFKFITTATCTATLPTSTTSSPV